MARIARILAIAAAIGLGMAIERVTHAPTTWTCHRIESPVGGADWGTRCRAPE